MCMQSPTRMHDLLPPATVAYRPEKKSILLRENVQFRDNISHKSPDRHRAIKKRERKRAKQEVNKAFRKKKREEEEGDVCAYYHHP